MSPSKYNLLVIEVINTVYYMIYTKLKEAVLFSLLLPSLPHYILTKIISKYLTIIAYKYMLIVLSENQKNIMI